MTSGAGIYFDGQTSARHDVVVALGASALQIGDRDGRLVAEWAYDDILGLTAPDNVLRIGRRSSASLERLEILDPQFAAALDDRAAYVDRAGTHQRRQRISVIGWSVAATVAVGAGRLVRRAGDCRQARPAGAGGHRPQTGRRGRHAGARHSRYPQCRRGL
ncbi:MAG: hypothetical protein WDN48_19145 [Pseudolabrys sp.]